VKSCPLMLNPVEFVADRDLRSLTIEGPITMLISYYWGSYHCKAGSTAYQGHHCSIVLVIYAIQFDYS